MSSNDLKKGIFWGFIFIAAGIILLIDNLELVQFNLPCYVISWKSLLIFIGLYFLFVTRHKITGIIFFSLGVLFILPEALNLPQKSIFAFWPLILILIGAVILLKRSMFHRLHERFVNNKVKLDYIDETAVFGGGEHHIITDSFKGGNFNAVFGGSDFDLLESKLARGENILSIFALFGGFSLRVPSSWRIKIQVTPIFGGVVDKRRRMPHEEPESSEGVLHIKGVVIFGGGEITNKYK